MARIYTRTGDERLTALFDGSRVPKDYPRVEAYGTIDELNSILGMLIGEDIADILGEKLQRLQNTLFVLGADLASPSSTPWHVNRIEDHHILEIELWIDTLDAELPTLTNFILPGGSKIASLFHLARTVARRAERRVIEIEDVSPQVLQYCNRLSDLFFVMSRYANFLEGNEETLAVL